MTVLRRRKVNSIAEVPNRDRGAIFGLRGPNAELILRGGKRVVSSLG